MMEEKEPRVIILEGHWHYQVVESENMMQLLEYQDQNCPSAEQRPEFKREEAVVVASWNKGEVIHFVYSICESALTQPTDVYCGDDFRYHLLYEEDDY